MTKSDSLSLEALGPRIAILGPSNAGKSTLAQAIAMRRNLPLVHLDQLRHIPNTQWKARSEEAFAALHAAAVAEPHWVIEGNYTAYATERLERATGVVVLNAHVGLRLFRYLRRCLNGGARRIGHLQGAQERINWEMVQWIVGPSRRTAHDKLRLAAASGSPWVDATSTAKIRLLYAAWDLPVPRR